MTFDALVRVLAALGEADVRYLVAGGVAVNAHGYQRLTHDVDLILDLAPPNVRGALEALAAVGYEPSLPVSAEGFADEETRRRWRERHNMQVFSLVAPEAAGLAVDLFVEPPFPDFQAEYERALVAEVAPGVEARFVALETLIAMKRKAGRGRDHDDVNHLEWIRSRGEPQDD